MNKIIGVTELQRRFRAVFDEVVENRTPYVLTRGSRPEAAIVPYDDYVKYVKAHEEEVHARFDAMLKRLEQVNAKYTDDEVERDVEQVSRTVRARRQKRRAANKTNRARKQQNDSGRH